MAARGLSASSMAGAAIMQAAMESSLPIAAQDAQVFREINFCARLAFKWRRLIKNSKGI